jgi:hypothetical protein
MSLGRGKDVCGYPVTGWPGGQREAAMAPRQWRAGRRATAAAVLVAATVATGTGSASGTGAVAARAAGAGPATAAPALAAAQRGTIRLGSAGSITLDAAGSGQPALPADPTTDWDAYRSCRDLSTPPIGTLGNSILFNDPDPPAGNQSAGLSNPNIMSWGPQFIFGVNSNEAVSSYAGGYSNASKLAGSAFVPPALSVGQFSLSYPNPPLKPDPYSDPTNPAVHEMWHSADPSTDSSGGLWVSSTTPAADNKVFYCQLLIGQLDNDPTAKFPPTPAQATFPPVTATFLANGFVPITATVHLDEQTSGGRLIPVAETAYQQYKHSDGELPGGLISGTECDTLVPSGQCIFNYCWFVTDATGNTVNQCSDYVIDVTAAVTLRLSDVTVNGTPLDVGSHCQTTGPLYTPDNPADPANDRVVLQGGSNPSEPSPQWPNTDQPNSNGAGIFNGGPVAGYVTIPPFTGCVTAGGDNLDPLLDATVSGPGNYIKVTVAPPCSDFGPNLCTDPLTGTSGNAPDTDPQARAVPPTQIYR